MDKLAQPHSGMLLGDNRHELQPETWRDCRCMLLSGSVQSESHTMIPTIRHSGKGNTRDSEKTMVFHFPCASACVTSKALTNPADTDREPGAKISLHSGCIEKQTESGPLCLWWAGVTPEGSCQCLCLGACCNVSAELKRQ